MHGRGILVAEIILGSSCAKIEESNETATQEDLQEYFVAAWSILPELIPCEKNTSIPEPEIPIEGRHPVSQA